MPVSKDDAAKRARVREVNDEFRRTLTRGRVTMTSGVNALGVFIATEALTAVRRFTAFNAGNDPHGAHDFGTFETVTHKFFGKSTTIPRTCRTDRKIQRGPSASSPSCQRRNIKQSPPNVRGAISFQYKPECAAKAHASPVPALNATSAQFRRAASRRQRRRLSTRYRAPT